MASNQSSSMLFGKLTAGMLWGMDRQNPRITVKLATFRISDEGREFRSYVASYVDLDHTWHNTTEDGKTEAEALEKLYRALEECRGFSRGELPPPIGA
jgi:predicted RNase H-like HicB family nuclease